MHINFERVSGDCSLTAPYGSSLIAAERENQCRTDPRHLRVPSRTLMTTHGGVAQHSTADVWNLGAGSPVDTPLERRPIPGPYRDRVRRPRIEHSLKARVPTRQGACR